MNNDFNYNSGYQYQNPFTNEPQYDFYDELVVKDAKRTMSRSMLSLVFYTVAVLALSQIVSYGLLFIVNELMGNTDLYMTIVQSPYVSAIVAVIAQYAVAIPVLFLVIRRLPKKQISIEKPKMSVPQLLMMIPIAEAAMLTGSYIGTFVSTIYSAMLGVENQNAVSDMIDNFPLPLIIVLTVIMAPVFEELIFRKLLLDRLSVYGNKFAIIVTAVAFGLWHGNLDQLFYATLVGMVLGYVAVKSGNWLYSVVIHMVMNFLGGVLPSLLSDSFEKYEEFAEELIEDPLAYTSIPAEYALDIFVVTLYSAFISTLAIGGIVLITIGLKKRWFTVDERLTIRIPRGRARGVIFKNVGSILMLVLSGILMMQDIIAPLLEQIGSASGGMGV